MTKEQKLLVYLLSGNYCSRNCIFSKEGREDEEEGETEAGMLEAVQRIQRSQALPISTMDINSIPGQGQNCRWLLEKAQTD